MLAAVPAASQGFSGGVGVAGDQARTVPDGARPSGDAAARRTGSPFRFGSRVLRLGTRGKDVKVLHGIVRARPYARRVKLVDVYHRATVGAVRRFQAERSLPPTGTVGRRTARALAGSMKRADATWYGPGLYGNRTACGQVLRRGTVGVAHRHLPCGTRVTFRHGGRSLVTRVIDRGPFTTGIKWDLTNGARKRLGFDGSGPIRFAVSR